MRLQETDETTKMVLVPVAEYERVDGHWINTKQIHVVEKGFRRETEINQGVARLVAPSRLNVHRKAEFANQRSARRLVAETPAKVLDIKIGQVPARSDSELIAIDHYPNGHAVELRQ